MTGDVILLDATLRDGQHAVAHQLDRAQLAAYAAAADAAGVPVVEVGHGNGLGASSLQIGRARLSEPFPTSQVTGVAGRVVMPGAWRNSW